ncbi:EF-hand domain-containing protein [Novipirellula sp. SH528]|uniref:EF-hand domain-containing protein n=1 Tax=Novipirellula sp. SH528 TaxID=3454466 RepID=UPI003F9F0E32
MRLRYTMFFSAFVVVCCALETNAQQPGFGPGGGRGERGGENRERGERGERGGDRMRMIPVIAALDADSDGIISAKEIAGAVAALKTLDKNKDGQLTEDEMRPEFGGPGGPGGPGGGGSSEAVVARLMAMDQDGDGKLSQSELSGRLQSIMAKADTNKDGFATKAEIEAMAKTDAAAGGRPGGRRGGREGAGGREGGGDRGRGDRGRPE